MLKLSLLTLALASATAHSVERLPVTAIEDTVIATTNSVKDSHKYSMPIISWGADVATIYANGAKVTTDGSLIAPTGFYLELERQDRFQDQIKDYMKGKTPFLRGTMSMINLAAASVKGNDDLTPVVISQLSWSEGGDALVVKGGLKPKELCDKTIAINAFGPHLNYANRILKDAGCEVDKVDFFYTRDLTGTEQTPAEALFDDSVDAAFVITPDALALTSGGNVGTGAEGSVKGASIVMSTESASKVITDVIAVRKDFYQNNKSKVDSLAMALLKAQESLPTALAHKMLKEDAAELLFDSKLAVDEIEPMVSDAYVANFQDNKAFFTGDSARNFEVINKETVSGLLAMGAIKSAGTVLKADIDYRLHSNGYAEKVNQPKFDTKTLSAVVDKKQKLNTLDDDTLYSFDVFFRPNQRGFDSSLYQSEFDKVIELSAIYSGAVIIVEGHSDPMGYLRKVKQGESNLVLSRMKQGLKNLSLSRATEVRQSLIEFGQENNLFLDPSQFSVVGHGISQPKTGLCGAQPCAPKNEEQWLSNMRVSFRLLNVETEETAFNPL
ncbi:putative ABC-type nitrate/sulfonate/bicarbonate transport system, periplasmic components [Vibrio nigripulchritudo FTn2]|uniref:OmpA family protein n=1 Tax=Vibrio nigripulchritudo TaxID=28173 RepID=UPI0003B1F489|nr:OmpA family protein [Vibrio nigripulchritudo]CCN40091.1 putative ABC-type nitrate/sulfonate/bicarbonate transport system, periplasmic components [Vibrio nigripulchritudo FTn2]